MGAWAHGKYCETWLDCQKYSAANSKLAFQGRRRHEPWHYSIVPIRSLVNIQELKFGYFHEAVRFFLGAESTTYNTTPAFLQQTAQSLLPSCWLSKNTNPGLRSSQCSPW